MRQIRPAPAYNPHGLSEFNPKPQFVYQKQRKQEEVEVQRKKDEYLLQLKGENAFNPTWVQYHKVSDTLQPLAAGLKEKGLPRRVKPKEDSQFLPRDDYASGYERLVRTLKDDAVFGKPEFDLYYKGLGSDDKSAEFGGLRTKPFHCL